MDIAQFSRRMIELMPLLIRGFARHESNYLSRGEITLPQMWALQHLSSRGGCPMNELAYSLGISRPSATGLIDRLIAQQLVRREGDRRDRRIIWVRISPKGQRVLDNIWEQKRRTLSRVFGQVSPADRAQYLATLERVVHILGDKP